MASVRQIASQAGVSVATVSRALNNHPDVSAETRRKVLEVADNAGYAPAIGRRPTNVIGLIYPDDPVRPDFGNFESAMLQGLLKGTNELKFDLTFINLHRDKTGDETYRQFFHRKGIRGAVMRALENTGEIAEAIAAEGLPAIFIADRSDDPRVNFIACESRTTSERAVEHLIHLGHTRIALGVHAGMDSDHHDREDGYAAALARHGIERREDYTVKAVASPEGGQMMLDRLLALPEPPTAIYFTDPMSTVGALHRCLHLGVRVPAELSIVGFDDSDVRFHTYPRFTAVCQDAYALGLEASRWLTRSLSGDAHRVFRQLRETTFSVHESTGLVPDEPAAVRDGKKVSRSD